jgi:hypothetical protein
VNASFIQTVASQGAMPPAVLPSGYAVDIRLEVFSGTFFSTPVGPFGIGWSIRRRLSDRANVTVSFMTPDKPPASQK